MKRWIGLFFLMIGFLVGCAPTTAEDCYDDELFDEVDQVCYLQCEIDDSCEADDGSYEEASSFLGDFIALLESGGVEVTGEEEDTELLVRYRIDGNQIIDREELGKSDDDTVADQKRQEKIWRQFSEVIPSEYRRDISHYGVFSDGEGNLLAFVEPNPDDNSKWGLNVDPADASDHTELLYTLIHEFTHVFTLNSRQVPFNADVYYADDDESYEKAVEACSTYFTGEGCANRNAYIADFHNRFWLDIEEEHLQIDSEDEDGLYAFYEKYEDRFVTDYAATDTAEDIAETFSYFVLQPKPKNKKLTIVDQKILFFYEFPETVKLREQILARLSSQTRRLKK